MRAVRFACLFLFLCAPSSLVFAKVSTLPPELTKTVEAYKVSMTPESSYLERLGILQQICQVSFANPKTHIDLMEHLSGDFEAHPNLTTELFIGLQSCWKQLSEDEKELFEKPLDYYKHFPQELKDVFEEALLFNLLTESAGSSLAGISTGFYFYATETVALAARANQALLPTRFSPQGLMLWIVLGVILEVASDNAINHFYQQRLVNGIKRGFNRIEKLNQKENTPRNLAKRIRLTEKIVKKSIRLAVFKDRDLLEEIQKLVNSKKVDEGTFLDDLQSVLNDHSNFQQDNMGRVSSPSFHWVQSQLQHLQSANAEQPELAMYQRPLESYTVLLELIYQISQNHFISGDVQ